MLLFTNKEIRIVDASCIFLSATDATINHDAVLLGSGVTRLFKYCAQPSPNNDY